MATIKKAQFGTGIVKKALSKGKELAKGAIDKGKKIASAIANSENPEKVKREGKNLLLGAKSATGLKKGGVVKKAKSGGSFPDLNKDGKITKADILKGRGVIAKKGAAVPKMKSGGKCKNGC